jgi:phosphatidylglycerophosphate synthase
VTRLLALVLNDGPPLTVGGLTLPERAILLSDRAGLPVVTWGPRGLDATSRRRLSARGVTPAVHAPEQAPLDGVGRDAAVVVVASNALFSPALLTCFAAGSRPGDAPRAVVDGEAPALLYLPAGAAASLSDCRSIGSMVERLTARGTVRPWPLGGEFGRVVRTRASAASAERDYIRHLNGRKESFFTKKIRRFSVPLTSRLVRHGARPALVTLGGLVLAATSAWCLARGSYLAGLLGAILYYTSMVFDCSDGEVARLTLRDSAFGAWFETFVDYATYLMLLAALAVASRMRPDAWALKEAALVALAGSAVVIATASFLRLRVARADPGQFDEASANALESTTRLNRFARWGRQWIKRSTLAHLVVALALVNQTPVLLYLWAFGATVAAVVILAVQPFVIQRVVVKPAHLNTPT